MALIDPNPTGRPESNLAESHLAFASARLPKRFHDRGFPAQALARLAELHNEAHQALQLSQVLARAPHASLALMLSGALFLLEAFLQGGASLAAAFVWSLWLLTGILAMTVIYIRNFAGHPARLPLDQAVWELRKFLLYTGLALGLGAFLIMPDQPSPGLVLAFAVLPAWLVSLILRNEKAALAFATPATLLTASACILRPWSYGVLAAAIIIPAWAAGAFMLHRVNHRRVSALS